MKNIYKCMSAALVLASAVGCSSGSKKTDADYYTADQLLSAVNYDVDDYVKLPDLDSIHTRVTGNYKTSKKEIDNYINAALKNTKGLKKKTVKTLTDKDCKKHLGYNTVDEYWQSVRKRYVDDNRNQLNTDKKTAVTNYLVSASKIRIPDGLVRQMTDDQIQQYKNYSKQQGVSYKSYIKTVYKYTDESKFRKYVENGQKKQAKNDLVQQAVIKKTGYKLKKSDFRKFIKQYCKTYSMKEKDVYRSYGSEAKIRLAYAQNDAITELAKKAKIKVVSK